MTSGHGELYCAFGSNTCSLLKAIPMKSILASFVSALVGVALYLPASGQTTTSIATAPSESEFPWEQAKKIMSREFTARRFRPSTIVGHQTDAPGKVSVYVYLQGGGTLRVPFYFLSTDIGRKWFLVLENEKDASPVPVE